MKDLVRHLAARRSIEPLFTGGNVEWSADGKYLYSPCTNVVKAINLDDNLNTFSIGEEDETLQITQICLDKSRFKLYVAYSNYIVREYALPDASSDKKAATVVRMWKTMHTAPILLMQLNNEGTKLATGSADNNVKIWDVVQQHCTHTLKGSDVVSALCFIRDERLIVGYSNGEVNMFNLMRGAIQKLLHTWNSHSSRITSIVSANRGRKNVFLSRDQTATIVDVETREVLKVLPLFEHIESAIVADNGNLVTVGEEGVVKEWILDTARMVRRTQISQVRIDFLSYNIIRNQLLAVSAEENLFVVNFADFSISRQIVGFHDEIYSCCLLGKEQSHIAVASNTKEIRLYDAETWDCTLVPGHSESVLCVTSAAWDHNLLASCSKDNAIILWRLMKNPPGRFILAQLFLATGHTNTVNAVRLSHTNRRPFLLSVSTDCTLKLWSLEDQNLNAPVKQEANKPAKLACSSTIVAHNKDVNCLDVALSDSLCITGGMDKLAKVWHIDSQRMQLGIVGSLTGHRRGVAGAVFSPNSQKVATCSGDMTIKVWALQDRTCLQTLNGHNSAIFNVIFVNHGSQLVSADSAGIIKIWNLSTNECESSVEAHSDKIWTLLATPDESEYITAGTDGRIVIWKDISEEKRLEEDKTRRKKVEEEQTLSNLLEQDRFQDALEFALGLARPFCALKVIDQLIDREELTDALAKLSNDKVQILLDFSTQWNTNSKTSQTSQLVLNSILRIHPPEELLKLPNIATVVQSFLPYTKRHLERLNKARQDVTLLNFTWDQMRLN